MVYIQFPQHWKFIRSNESHPEDGFIDPKCPQKFLSIQTLTQHFLKTQQNFMIVDQVKISSHHQDPHFTPKLPIYEYKTNQNGQIPSQHPLLVNRPIAHHRINLFQSAWFSTDKEPSPPKPKL